jgi:hypothetical protein
VPLGLALVLQLPRPAAAAWPTDPLVNVPFCTAASTQKSPTIVTDGAGGAIVTWSDYRSGSYSDIYAQRVRANGQLGGNVADVAAERSLALALDPVRPNPTRHGAVTVRFALGSSTPA